MPRLRVAVLMGGRSSEHEISLASARSVLEALDPTRYDATTIAIGRDGRWQLNAASPNGEVVGTLPIPAERRVPTTLGDVDVVLPVLQGLLELAGVPYVGAGVLASALCMDKDRFKSVMRGDGIPVTRSVTLLDGDPVENPFGFPVFVKPARLGSSVGVTKAHDEEELEE